MQTMEVAGVCGPIMRPGVCKIPWLQNFRHGVCHVADRLSCSTRVDPLSLSRDDVRTLDDEEHTEPSTFHTFYSRALPASKSSRWAGVSGTKPVPSLSNQYIRSLLAGGTENPSFRSPVFNFFMISETRSLPVSPPIPGWSEGAPVSTSTRKNRGTAYAGKALCDVLSQSSSWETTSRSVASASSDAVLPCSVIAAQPSWPS